MTGILTKKEWASLMLMRVSKEPSRALPRQAYMDAAASVMFESERIAKPASRRARREQKKTGEPVSSGRGAAVLPTLAATAHAQSDQTNPQENHRGRLRNFAGSVEGRRQVSGRHQCLVGPGKGHEVTAEGPRHAR